MDLDRDGGTDSEDGRTLTGGRADADYVREQAKIDHCGPAAGNWPLDGGQPPAPQGRPIVYFAPQHAPAVNFGITRKITYMFVLV